MKDLRQTVAVIISHVNSARTIENCVKHVIRQDYPRNLIRIVVVDAGSTDGSIEIIENIDDERLRQIVVRGCTEAEGQILGVQSSDSDIIMFTNSDIYVPPDWITKHVEWLERGFDLVGGKVFWGGDKFSLTWNMPTPRAPVYVQQPGLGLGFSNCSVRKAYLKRVGGLKNIASQHDTEFAFRVVKMGGKMLLDPAIEVYHDHPFESIRGSYLRSFGYALNHVLIMRTSFNQLVCGSGSPAMLPIATLIKEWAGINGVKTYRELYPKALSKNIQTSLLKFIIVRLLSVKLGQIIGAFFGAIRFKSKLSIVPDIHARHAVLSIRQDPPRV